MSMLAPTGGGTNPCGPVGGDEGLARQAAMRRHAAHVAHQGEKRQGHRDLGQLTSPGTSLPTAVPVATNLDDRRPSWCAQKIGRPEAAPIPLSVAPGPDSTGRQCTPFGSDGRPDRPTPDGLPGFVDGPARLQRCRTRAPRYGERIVTSRAGPKRTPPWPNRNGPPLATGCGLAPPGPADPPSDPPEPTDGLVGDGVSPAAAGTTWTRTRTPGWRSLADAAACR